MEKVVVKLKCCNSTIIDPEDIFIAGECLIVKKDDKNEFSFPKDDIKDLIKIDENGNTTKALVKILNEEEAEEYINKRIEKDKKDRISKRLFLYYENFGRTEIEDVDGTVKLIEGKIKIRTKKGDYFEIPISYVYRIDSREDDGHLYSMHIRKLTEEEQELLENSIPLTDEDGGIMLEDKDDDDDDWFNELLKG